MSTIATTAKAGSTLVAAVELVQVILVTAVRLQTLATATVLMILVTATMVVILSTATSRGLTKYLYRIKIQWIVTKIPKPLADFEPLL